MPSHVQGSPWCKRKFFYHKESLPCHLCETADLPGSGRGGARGLQGEEEPLHQVFPRRYLPAREEVLRHTVWAPLPDAHPAVGPVAVLSGQVSRDFLRDALLKDGCGS